MCRRLPASHRWFGSTGYRRLRSYAAQSVSRMIGAQGVYSQVLLAWTQRCSGSDSSWSPLVMRLLYTCKPHAILRLCSQRWDFVADGNAFVYGRAHARRVEASGRVLLHRFSHRR